MKEYMQRIEWAIRYNKYRSFTYWSKFGLDETELKHIISEVSWYGNLRMIQWINKLYQLDERYTAQMLFNAIFRKNNDLSEYVFNNIPIDHGTAFAIAVTHDSMKWAEVFIKYIDKNDVVDETHAQYCCKEAILHDNIEMLQMILDNISVSDHVLNTLIRRYKRRRNIVEVLESYGATLGGCKNNHNSVTSIGRTE